VSDTQALVKVSFAAPVGQARLRFDGRAALAERTDTDGRFWRFRIDGLAPGTAHTLQLEADGRPVGEAWSLRTFPARNAMPERFRLLTFTCAGGLEGAKSINNIDAFRSLALRRRLLARGLSFAPDAVIANGDHIYWDQKAWLEHPHPEIRRLTREAYDRFGYLDRSALMFGTANEAILKRLADPQIAELYGTMLKGVPSFFVNDDHDYFENDDATPEYVSFPPDDFQVRAARAVQRMYYPEFLPDAERPAAMSGASAPDNGEGVSECFGTLRFGRLFEAVIYDCGRFLTLKGAQGGLVPEEVEAWLIARTRAEDTAHFAHVPSHPMGWSAGKWREWYRDVVAAEGEGEGAGAVVVATHGEGVAGKRLTAAREKFMWQAGWRAQHDRLVGALCAQTKRAALMVSGDLHAVGWGQMTRAGEMDLSANPLTCVLPGPVSTAGAGWPSFARGTPPLAPSGVVLEQPDGGPRETNGFAVLDATPEALSVRLFSWREPMPEEAIDTLEPFATVTLPRRS
jgi:hypothetical protein